MPNTIWNKYKKEKELDNNGSNCKSILSTIQVIIKEIHPKDNNEYYFIKENLEYLKSSNEIKIYDIIEENGKIYAVIDADSNISEQFNLLIDNQSVIKKEGITLNKNPPISKKEIFDIFKMEKAICRIHFQDSKGKDGTGTGFFCEIDD